MKRSKFFSFILIVFTAFLAFSIISCEKKEKGEEAEKQHDINSAQLAVPEQVKASFKTKFAVAEEVEWGMESAEEYEAEFEMHDKKMSANFDKNGKWLVTETILSENELPASILAALKQQFPGYEIEKAEKLEEAGKPVLFEVKLEKDENEQQVVLNESGQVIKKGIKSEEDEN